MDAPARSPTARALRVAAALAIAALLSACQALVVTAAGVGASAGVMRAMDAQQNRTFTSSAAQVRKAVHAALAHMGVEIVGTERRGGSDVMMATSAGRDIEVQIEPMSRSTTQLRATAKRNLFAHDAATAREIIEQTEALLDARNSERRRASAPERTVVIDED